MTLVPGTTVGRYQILEPLGQGGMATVYKAFQPSLEREVALKVLRPGFAQDDEFRERFEREAKAIARLRHPHIVQVFDFESTSAGDYALAMEYLEGGTLKERLTTLASQGHGLDPEHAVRIIGEVAEALAYAHEKGIVHRDVKPSNVMLTRKDWAVVTDFGIARILGATSHTQTGVGIGTPEYMAPEQGQGGQIDHRADIYSLGAMAYELLVGRVPYTADTPLAIVIAHIKDPLPLPSIANPTIGKGVERALLRALAKDPAQRYETATAFADALRAGLVEDSAEDTTPTIVVRRAAPTAVAPAATVAPASVAAKPSPSGPLARRPVELGVAGALVLALVAGTVVASNALRPSASPAPGASAGPAVAGSFASHLGELIYQPKLDQAPTNMTGEVTLNGEMTATKVGGGQIEMTAPAGQMQTEVVFNAGAYQREQYAMAMQVTVDPASTLRFALCPRSGLASAGAPASSYCFTFLLRASDPSYTIELRHSGAGPNERVGEPVSLPKQATFKIGMVANVNVFRLWIDDRQVLDRADDRLRSASVPPLAQVSRLGSDPQLGGTVRIKDVKLYRLAGATGAVAPTPAPGTCQFPPCPSAPAPAAAPVGTPKFAVPTRGTLLFEAKLDGSGSDLRNVQVQRGAPGDAKITQAPGVIEATVQEPVVSVSASLNTTSRLNYIYEAELSAGRDSNTTHRIRLRNAPPSQGGGWLALDLDLGQASAALRFWDPSKNALTDISDRIDIPQRAGQQFVVAVVVNGDRIEVYVDQQKRTQATETRANQPTEIALELGGTAGVGSVRITGLRIYALP